MLAVAGNLFSKILAGKELKTIKPQRERGGCVEQNFSRVHMCAVYRLSSAASVPSLLALISLLCVSGVSRPVWTLTEMCCPVSSSSGTLLLLLICFSWIHKALSNFYHGKLNFWQNVSLKVIYWDARYLPW